LATFKLQGLWSAQVHTKAIRRRVARLDIANYLMLVSRKLVAVVMAGPVGNARLVERDDTGTCARLRTIRDEGVYAVIVSHGAGS